MDSLKKDPLGPKSRSWTSVITPYPMSALSIVLLSWLAGLGWLKEREVARKEGGDQLLPNTERYVYTPNRTQPTTKTIYRQFKTHKQKLGVGTIMQKTSSILCGEEVQVHTKQSPKLKIPESRAALRPPTGYLKHQQTGFKQSPCFWPRSHEGDYNL